MFHIDDELKELLEGGVAVVVGTADAAMRPHVTPGWGPRVMGDRCSIHLFLESARAEQAIADLQATGRIAMTVADPVSYRSVQIKGCFIGTTPVTPDEETWVQRHRDAFASTTALVGESPEAIRNAWMQDVVRVEFEAERAFDQTPGPMAGRPL